MNEKQFKKELSELMDILPKPKFGIDCIMIHISESAYDEFNRLRQELWEKFKEQEEIRDEYYKLLDNV